MSYLPESFCHTKDSNSFQSPSSDAVVQVIVIVALAEELLASVWLVVISLSGLVLSAREVSVSDTPDVDNPTSITTRAIKRIILFTSATSQPCCGQEYSKSETLLSLALNNIHSKPTSGHSQYRYFTQKSELFNCMLLLSSNRIACCLSLVS